MRTALRLWRIEQRRSIGLWTLPVIVAAAWLLARNDLNMGVLLWTQSSVLVRDTLFFAGPLVGGAAAWMAGRDRRRNTEDLLRTVPAPDTPRQLAIWAATTLWAMAGYLLFGAYIVAVTAREATWGAPILWPMFIGLLAIPAYAAVGYALGHYLPGRFTAPLTGIALFALQIAVGWLAASFIEVEWIRFLSPIVLLQTPVWYGVLPPVGLPQALFLLGVTALGLASVGLRHRRRAVYGATALVGAVLVVSAVFLLVDMERRSVASMYDPANYDPIPYEPACRGQHLPVCLHPAYALFLGELAPDVQQMAEPLAGLPGMPQRVVQPVGFLGLPEDVKEEVVAVHLSTYPFAPYNAAYEIADHLVSDTGRPTSSPQLALKIWLLRRANREIHCQDGPDSGRSIFNVDRCEAADRFGSLSPVEQRQWLEGNYQALRAGELQVETIP